MPTAEYTISARLTADMGDFGRGLAAAERSLQQARRGFSEYGAEADAASRRTQSFVERNRGHMETVGKGAMVMGGAVLAGVGLAIHAYSEFSGRMAQVQSLSHASSAEMEVLSKAALSMGTSFGLSANDVADAQIELVKAGISVKEMLGGALPGALALAAAGQIEVGQATEIATIALTQFKLAGKDVPHVADLLAAGADKALGGVYDLGMGLKQGGQVAASFGLSIEDTIGTLAGFANAGLMGSDAGTSLKTMLIALANPSKEARDTMAQLGFSAFDVNEKFVGIVSIAEQLKQKLGSQSDAQQKAALATIFGSDAIRSSTELMKLGGEGIRKWIKDVDDQGFAAKQAAGKMNSLNGDFKKLQAVVQTGLIQMGSTGSGFLRPVVKGLTEAVQAFNNLPEPVKGGMLAFAGFGGAALLLGGFLLTTIPKIYDSVKAVQALTAASPRAAAALGAIGKAALPLLALVTAALIIERLNDAMMPASVSAEQYTQKLIELGKAGRSVGDVLGKDMFARANVGKLKPVTTEIDGFGDAIARVNNMDFNDSVNDWFDSIGVNSGSQIKEVKASIKGIDTALSDLAHGGAAESASKSFRKLTEDAKAHGVSVETTAKSFPQYLNTLRTTASDMGVFLNDQELLNYALGEMPQKMIDAQNSTEVQAKMAELAAQRTEEQKKALDDLGIAADGAILHLDRLVGSMIQSGLISLSARDAARQFEAAIDALDESIKQNGTTLDRTTEKGRANEAAFDAIAGAGLRSAEAMAKNGASQEDVQANLRGTYDALIAAAGKFGITGEAADAMAREVLKVPKDVPIDTAIQNYADTMAKLQAIKAGVDRIQGKSIDVVVNHINNQVAGGGFADDPSMTALTPGRSFGGAIEDAPGPKGVDSKNYRLAKGEHVLTAQDVDAMGGQQAVYAMRQQLHNGSLTAARVTQPVAQQTAVGSLGNLTVYVQNPFTGEQVRAAVVTVARNEVENGFREANNDFNRGKTR